MRSSAPSPIPRPTRPGRRPSTPTTALVGRLAGLRQRARPSSRRSAPVITASWVSTSRGSPPPKWRRTLTSPASIGQLLARSRDAPLALHARAQRDLRPPRTRSTPGSTTRSSTRTPGSQRRAHGEDPHGRMDDRGHRPPDDRRRAADQLVRDPRRGARRRFGRRTSNEVIRGIPGSPANTTACRTR